MSQRQQIIKHCVLHTLISAAPSFVIAIYFGWQRVSQIIGMLFGILAFLVCAIFLHLHGPIAEMKKYPNAANAIKWTKRIRLVQALLAFFICLITMGPMGRYFSNLGQPLDGISNYIVIVDLWAGMLAVTFTEQFGFGRGVTGVTMGESKVQLFGHAFLNTFIEGWILALGLAVVCLCIWGVIGLLRRVSFLTTAFDPSSGRE